MSGFATPRLEHPSLSRLVLRHRWLAASLGAHLLLAGTLYTAGPVRVERKRADNMRVAVDASLRQTSQREMRRQLRAMEEIKEALERAIREEGGVPVDHLAAQDLVADRQHGDGAGGGSGGGPRHLFSTVCRSMSAVNERPREARCAK